LTTNKYIANTIKVTPKTFDSLAPVPLNTFVSLERVDANTTLNTKTGMECPRPKTASINPAFRGEVELKSDAITTGRTKARLHGPRAIDTIKPSAMLAIM